MLPIEALLHYLSVTSLQTMSMTCSHYHSWTDLIFSHIHCKIIECFKSTKEGLILCGNTLSWNSFPLRLRLYDDKKISNLASDIAATVSQCIRLCELKGHEGIQWLMFVRSQTNLLHIDCLNACRIDYNGLFEADIAHSIHLPQPECIDTASALEHLQNTQHPKALGLGYSAKAVSEQLKASCRRTKGLIFVGGYTNDSSPICLNKDHFLPHPYIIMHDFQEMTLKQTTSYEHSKSSLKRLLSQGGYCLPNEHSWSFIRLTHDNLLKAQGLMISGCCPFVQSFLTESIFTPAVDDDDVVIDKTIDMSSPYSYHGSGMQHLATFSRIQKLCNFWSSPDPRYAIQPSFAKPFFPNEKTALQLMVATKTDYEHYQERPASIPCNLLPNIERYSRHTEIIGLCIVLYAR